ncbi:hypothetical protein BT63DRAFT_19269 [Microthyrium microscopicum]|uniref:Uncharacterized protein n=1 Tax=Microthyrium microscopicum TaxID=703497 RepID=A0A6A6USJ5_9PEZI|nr:hypothetical protein BT63DRAFT_19269 [Microthyrium microscopicum]
MANPQRPPLFLNTGPPSLSQPQAAPLPTAMRPTNGQNPASTTPYIQPQSQPPPRPQIPAAQHPQYPQHPQTPHVAPQRPRPSSPSESPAPPHSPLTPKAVAAQLATMTPYNAPSVLAQMPDPIPIAESDNPDAIALRSALMILQLQRETAKRDMTTLTALRAEATRDPEGYVKELVRRQRETERNGGAPDLLAPTLEYLVKGLGKDAELLRVDEEMATAGSADKGKERVKDEGSDSEEETNARQSKFAAPPKAQNIFRMPPVNWAKYHVDGTALDHLHEDQRARPMPGVPALPGQEGGRAEPYLMAGPYQPVIDAERLGASEHPMKTRRGHLKK